VKEKKKKKKTSDIFCRVKKGKGKGKNHQRYPKEAVPGIPPKTVWKGRRKENNPFNIPSSTGGRKRKGSQPFLERQSSLPICGITAVGRGKGKGRSKKISQ